VLRQQVQLVAYGIYKRAERRNVGFAFGTRKNSKTSQKWCQRWSSRYVAFSALRRDRVSQPPTKRVSLHSSGPREVQCSLLILLLLFHRRSKYKRHKRSSFATHKERM
jgi:hypothetical protein